MRLLLISLITTLCLSFQVQAKAPIAPINVYVYAMDYAKEHKSIFLQKSPNSYTEVGLSTANIYGPYKAIPNKEGKICIYNKVKVQIDGAELTVHKPIGEVVVTGRIKEPVLILVPSGEKEMVYKILVMDRGKEDFPMGSYKMFNFSPRKLRGLIGKTKIEVGSWKRTSFHPSKDNDADRVQVLFQYQVDKNWQTFGATKWNIQNDKRKILCAYIEPNKNRMKIRSIPVKEPVKQPIKK